MLRAPAQIDVRPETHMNVAAVIRNGVGAVTVLVLVCLGGATGAQTGSKVVAPPAVGDPARNFVLTSLAGVPVALSETFGKGPVVLVMLRGWPGYDCPFCTRQFGDYLAHADALQAAGARVLFVYPGPREGLSGHASNFTAGKTIPAHFTFLMDPDFVFTNLYGLRWNAPQETAYPSTFVLDARGTIILSEVSKEHGGRVAVTDVLKAMASGPASGPLVVAELFTSEGCSSCPPADALLRLIAAGELRDAADVLTIGEHVDYWDRLGWRDPFSAAVFSARQSSYGASVFGTDNIYTPQLVVDGRFQALGSSLEAVRGAIAQAARFPKAAVELDVEPAAGQLRVRVRIDLAALPSHAPADVIVALTEDDLTTRVERGENGGKTLRHGAVARILKTIGRLAAGDRSYAGTIEVPIAPEWQLAKMRVAAFLQERGTRHILGAGQSGVGPGSEAR